MLIVSDVNKHQVFVCSTCYYIATKNCFCAACDII